VVGRCVGSNSVSRELTGQLLVTYKACAVCSPAVISIVNPVDIVFFLLGWVIHVAALRRRSVGRARYRTVPICNEKKMSISTRNRKQEVFDGIAWR
jgi:hypothetical protein